MLPQEIQRSAITALILLLHILILEITPRRHPAVNLGRESLDIVIRLQCRAKLGHIVGVLVFTRQEGHGDIDILGVIRVQHGRVTLHGCLECLVLGAGGENGDLAAPAVAEDAPGGEAAAGGGWGCEGVGFGDDAGDLGEGVGGCGFGLEESAELLLVVVGLRGEPGNVGGLALEEIGHEDAVFLRGGGGEDVGALKGLGKEAKNVYSVPWLVWGLTLVRRGGESTVDDEDGLSRRFGARDVCYHVRVVSNGWNGGRTCLQAIDGLVFALGLVALGDDRGNAVGTILLGDCAAKITRDETHEQQALLTPDMFEAEQWSGRWNCNWNGEPESRGCLREKMDLRRG